jgi:hypothetical protein
MNHDDTRSRRRKHRLMALVCIPLLLIVGFLILTGTLALGTAMLVAACVGAMGLMMFAMERTNHH